MEGSLERVWSVFVGGQKGNRVLRDVRGVAPSLLG